MSVFETIKKNVMKPTFVNILYSLGGKGIAMVFFLILDIVCARLLTTDDYGEWNFFYSIEAILFWIVGFGLNASARVYIAKFRESKEGMVKYACSGLILRCAITLFFVPIILWGGNKFVYNLGYPEKYANLKWLFNFGVFLCLFYSLNDFYKEVFVGMIEFKKLFWMTILEYAGYLIFSVLGIKIWGNSIGIAFGYVVALLVCVLAEIIILHREINFTSIKLSYDKEAVKTIFKYAIPLLLISFGTLILTEMDTVMLGLFATSTETGIYSVAKKLLSKVTHVNIAICSSVMPQFALLNRNNYQSKKKQYKKILLFNYCITLSVCVIIFTLGPIFIKILYGEKFIQAVSVLRILIGYYFMFGTGLFFSAFIDYQEKAKIRSVLYLGMCVLNVIFNYLLIPKFGADGAAWATVIAMIPYHLGLIIEVVCIFYKYKKD